MDEADLTRLLFGEDDLGAAYGASDLTTTPSASRRTARGSQRKRRAAAWNDDDENVTQGRGGGARATHSSSSSSSEQKSGSDAPVVDISRSSRLRKLRVNEGETTVTHAEYSKRLRTHYEKAHPTPAWAQRGSERKSAAVSESNSDSGSDNDEVSADGVGTTHTTAADANAMSDLSTAPLLAESRLLQPGALSITRVKDANHADTGNAVVQAVEFHHSGQMLLTAGFDKTLRLFQVDGRRNAKVQSVFLPDLPVHTAHFNTGQEEIVLSGRRPFFYVYDLARSAVRKVPRIMGRSEKSFERFVVSPDGAWLVFLGNDGNLIVVSGRTKQWVTNLKMNGGVRSAAFSPDGLHLLSFGDHGEVYTWDVRRWACVGRTRDEGSLGGSALATCARYTALGSTSGVVNVYDSDALAAGDDDVPAQPLKRLMHLTTPVDILRFNADAQLLCMASRRKKDSLKVLHLPSLTVFANWPTAATPLRYVSALDVSPNSGFLACGNDRGRVLLYRLNHFGKA